MRSSMQLLKQPSRVSCLPTAIAMVLDITSEEVMSWAGHSGDAVVFDKLVGFHPQEFIIPALMRGYVLVFVEVSPTGHKEYKNLNKEGLMKIMERNRCVLVGYTRNGNPHAVAYSGGVVYDPEGYTDTLDGFSIEYALVRV